MSRVRSRIGKRRDNDEEVGEAGKFGKTLGREIASMAKENDREVLEDAVNSTAMGVIEGMADELDVSQRELNEEYIQDVIEMFDVEEDDLILGAEARPPQTQERPPEVEEPEDIDELEAEEEEDTEDEDGDTDQDDGDSEE